MNTVTVDDLKKLVDVLGEDILAAFCQCFVHADRLLSLASWSLASREMFGGDSVAHSRDLSTMFYFALGTLHEAVSAVEGLEKAGIADRVGPDSCWPQLQDLVQSWGAFPRSKELRNTLGFHVDKNGKLMKRGLQRLIEEGGEVDIMRFDGKETVHWEMSFGLNVLYAGMRFAKTVEGDEDMDEDEREMLYIGQLTQTVAEGHQNFARLVQQLFAEVLEAAGIEFGEPQPVDT